MSEMCATKELPLYLKQKLRAKGILHDCMESDDPSGSDYNEEEEEVEDDRVAGGKMEGGGRLYLSDVLNLSHWEESGSHNIMGRDPRADHRAARMRLEEDAETARVVGSFSSLVTAPISSDGCNIKSILKRKNEGSHYEPQSGPGGDFKPQKRVRFDADFMVDHDVQEESEANGVKTNAVLADESFGCWSGVPDYVRNPSKYTHYTFDSTAEVDEESNTRAYMDFIKMRSGSNPDGRGDGDDVRPHGVYGDETQCGVVTFIPRRKTVCTNTAAAAMERRLTVGVSFGDIEESRTCAMEEDVPEDMALGRGASQRGRQYRMKVVSFD